MLVNVVMLTSEGEGELLLRGMELEILIQKVLSFWNVAGNDLGKTRCYLAANKTF